MAGMNPRAASRQSRTGERLDRDGLMVLVTVAVLAVAAVVVLVGLFLTWYRPPREIALTVDDTKFMAAQVQQRMLYLMWYETTVLGSDQTQFVTKTLERIERDEVVLRRAGTELASLEPDAVEKHLREMLAPPAPPAPQVSTDNPGVTVATPTPIPFSDEEYAKALQERLKKSEMTKADIEPIARVALLEKQLRAKFREGLSKNGPQVQLVVARLTDKAKADQVRSIGLRPGVDFLPVANINSVGGAGPAGDLGWILPEEMKQSVRDVVTKLKPGELSEVTPNGIYFEVYKVLAAEPTREYESAQLDTLLDEKFNAWVTAERAHVKFERVLSAGTEKWILDGAISKFRAQSPKTGG